MATSSNPPRIGNAERDQRLVNLRGSMAVSDLDAVLVTPGSNMRYFFGEAFYESDGLLER